MGDEARPREQVKSFVASKESLQRACLCREEKIILRFFGEGSHPVETVLGESWGSGRKTAPSTVFAGARYRHDSACGSGRFQIDLSDSGSGLILRFSGLKQNTLLDSFSYFSEVRLLFVNYLQSGFRVGSINCAEISRNHFPGDLYSERVQRFKAQNRLVGRFKKR
jgi:hypothetical protein